MSHIATAKVQIRSLDALRAACTVNGWIWLEGQKTYRWYGRWVGDSKMPEGMTTADLGKCDHAVSIPGCSYDIGVVARPDGAYTLAYDYWSLGGLARALGGNDLPKFAQAYSVEAAKLEAFRLGYAVEGQEVLQDGTVRLMVLV